METKSSTSPKKLNLAGRLAKLYIEHSQLNFLSVLIILVWGVTSFILMPKQYNPEIVAPAFSIGVDFPGASSGEVYELVTRPLEDKIREIKDVDEMASESYDGGESVVMVRFLVGSDMEKAKITLNQKIRDGLPEKPLGAGDSQIQALDPDDVPIMAIGLSSKNLSETSLRKMAFDLADEIKHVSGVSKTEVRGGRTNSLQVKLDTSKLAAYRLTIDDIAGAIESANGAYTVDRLKNENNVEKIRISGAISGKEDAKKIVLISPDRNMSLTLGDVADISYEPGEIDNYVRLNTQDREAEPLAYLAVSKLKGSNITDVSSAVRQELDRIRNLKQTDGADIFILRDEGETAGQEIGTLTKHLAISVIIVTVVLMLFLGLRNALIVAVAIPLTLLAAFGVGFLAGETINRITLFALILALGLLVDDAIVIIENIHRFIISRPGQNRRSLAILAVNEVGAGVFMSTITVLLAFIPMTFVTGMMGPYMRPIPFFVSASMLLSLFLAFTVNPALTAIIGAKNSKYHDNFFTKAIKRLENVYARTLQKLISAKKKRRSVIAGVFLLFLLSLSLPAFKLVQFRMLPKADKDQFYAYLDLPPDVTIAKTDNISRILEKSVLSFPEVKSVESTVGTAPLTDFNGLFRGSFARVGENQATLKIDLVSEKERKKTSEELASEMREILLQSLQDEPGAELKIVEDPPGPPVRSTIFLKVQGDNPEKLSLVAKDVETMLSEIQGVVDISDSSQKRPLEHTYRIDIEKAGRLGVSPADIARTIHANISGENVARLRKTEQSGQRQPEEEFIILRADPSDRGSVSDLSRIYLRNGQNQMILVSELVTENSSSILSDIQSDQQKKTISVSAEMDRRSVMYATLDLFPKLIKYHLPDNGEGLTSWSPLEFRFGQENEAVSIRIDGEWKLTLDVFRDLGIAMGLALFLIYFVLVVQLRSLMTPLLIMATIPLAFIGVLFGFAFLGILKGTFFNATSMIGVIALSGIVVKNAIIYLAYLYDMQASRKPLEEALVEAGRVRLLPIILTSITAILGSLVIVSDPVWEGLAWSIVFGLSVSTFLTLIIFPLLYLEFEGKNWNKHP